MFRPAGSQFVRFVPAGQRRAAPRNLLIDYNKIICVKAQILSILNSFIYKTSYILILFKMITSLYKYLWHPILSKQRTVQFC